jgi:hypothetical protein
MLSIETGYSAGPFILGSVLLTLTIVLGSLKNSGVFSHSRKLALTATLVSSVAFVAGASLVVIGFIQ